MQSIKVSSLDHVELDEILEPEEHLIWSGLPGYGRRFPEAVGDERTIHIAAFLIISVRFLSGFLS